MMRWLGKTGVTGAALLAWMLVCGAAPARENLIKDGDFNAYQENLPGVWEFRFGHKGGDYPKTRPFWKGVPRTDAASAEHGRFLSLEKSRPGAGTVLVGQRVMLPNPLPKVELAVDYQCFCQGEDRSGIVAVAIFTPGLWDKLPREAEGVREMPPRGDIVQVELQPQGDDVTVWKQGRVMASNLKDVLGKYAGKEVVVALIYTAWHDDNKEWAKFDNLHLGDALPHVVAGHWPRYVYKGDPLVLSADGSSDDPGARFVLQYRAAGGAGAWADVDMKKSGVGRYEGLVPAEAVTQPLEARAIVVSEKDKGLETEVWKMELTQRPEHPNLFRNKAQLVRMREKVGEFDWAKQAFERVKRNADVWLTKEFKPEVVCGGWWHHYNCPEDGARLKWDENKPHAHVCTKCGKVWDNETLYSVWWAGMHGRYSRAANDCAFTFQMTGEKKYARRAIEIVSWYADHYAAFPVASMGGKVGAQTLDECVWLLEMMDTADLVYSEMTPEEARNIERNLIYAGAMYTRKFNGGIHNISCWHNSTWGSAGYFLGDPDLINLARDGKNGFKAQMEKGVLEDGMWYERSMGYHDYTVMAITGHLEASRNAGEDLYKMPQVKKLYEFPLMITFPDMVPPSLNDGGYARGAIATRPLEIAYAWFGDPVVASALAKRYGEGTSRAFTEAWEYGEKLPEGTAYVAPPSMDLKGAGLAVLRRGTGAQAACAMLEYGEHGGGHGHPDKLQLILWGLGQQLCPDPGTTGYANPLHPNWYKNTVAHNTVVIGSRNMAEKSGKLVGFEANARYAATVIRTDAVYPGYVLTRRALLGDGFLVDEFIVEGTRPDTLDWFLRAPGDMGLSIAEIPVSEKAANATYGYLKEMKGGSTAGDWSATWMVTKSAEANGAARLVTTMRGTPATQVVKCKAPGPAGLGVQWDTLRVRRSGAQTRFVAVHQMVAAKESARAVSFDGQTVKVGDAVVDLGQSADGLPVLR